MSPRFTRDKKRFSQHGGLLHRALAIVVPVAMGALLTFAGSAAALGATPSPLGLAPVGQAGSYFDVTISAGETLQLEVARTNSGGSAVTARSYAGSVFTITNGGFGATNSGASPTGATRWVNYPDEVFTLAPATTDTKSFSVTVPAGTAPGQYISSIVLQENKATPGQGPVALAQLVRQAVAISIRVPGALDPSFSLGTVSHIAVAGNSVVRVALDNTGNQHVRPAGTIIIRDSSQKIVSQAPVTMGTVYADTSTRVAVTLNGTLQPGNYTATLSLRDQATAATSTITNTPFTVDAPAGEGPPDIIEIITDIIEAIVNPEPVPPVATPTPEPTADPVINPPSGVQEFPTPQTTSTSTPTPAPAPTITPLGEEPAAAASMTFSCGVGDALESCNADAHGVKLKPGSTVTLTAYSTPQVLLHATVGADGSWSAKAPLPTNLEPGPHSIVLEYTNNDGKPGTVAGGLILDDSLRVKNLSEPAAVAVFNEDTAAALERAAEAGAPIYDVAAHPVTTAAVAVAGVSLLGIVGVGGGGAPSGGGSGGASGGHKREDGDGGEEGDEPEGGDDPDGGDDPEEVDQAKTRKISLAVAASTAWGDRSGTWKTRGTTTVDSLSRTLPSLLSKHSSILQRFLLDGVWARAMFGSLSVVLLALGPVLVIGEFFVSHRGGILPAWPVLLLLIVLGVLDSLSGLLSFLTILIIAVLTGAIHSLPDVRMLIGLVIVLATLPMVSQAFRPTRRDITSRRDLLERVFDYVLPPIFLAFAAASMLKALNGLAGLELITPESLAMVRWAVGITVVMRLVCEDVSTIAYPARRRAVQPQGLAASSKTAALIAAGIGIAIFVFVTDAYFGLSLTTLIAAIIFATPMLARIWQDALPNSSKLYFWLPRGFVKYVLLLLVGIVLAKLVLGSNPSADSVAAGFLILMLPSLFGGVAEIFGRKGASFPTPWLPLAATAAAFVVGAGLVLGIIVIG